MFIKEGKRTGPGSRFRAHGSTVLGMAQGPFSYLWLVPLCLQTFESLVLHHYIIIYAFPLLGL